MTATATGARFRLSQRLRKLVLTIHVVTTVGWLGAVLVFVALAAIGLTSTETQSLRSALFIMEPLAWYVLVPLAAASLVVGIIQSLGTPWGLIRQYWVTFKLLITIFSTIVLISYMTTFNQMSEAALNPASTADQLRPFAGSVLLHGGLALAGLVISVVLSIYKPRALTPYGHRRTERTETPGS